MINKNLPPLKLSLTFPKGLEVQECYVYAGQLFFIFSDASFRSASLTKIVSQLDQIGKPTDEFHLFNFAFLRNDWFGTELFRSLYSIENIDVAFHNLWEKFSSEKTIELKMEDLTNLGTLPKMPIFDLRLFGMHAFIGNREGLFDATMIIEQDKDKVSMKGGFEKRLDARSTSLSTKAGSLLVSSNSDGLFHGNLVSPSEKIKMNERPIRSKSVRVGWSNYDVVNYESNISFDYLCSSHEKAEQRSYAYSNADESSSKVKITQIGETSYMMDDIFENKTELKKDLSFAFNSSNFCFLFYKGGGIKNVEFKKRLQPNAPEKWVHLSKKNNNLPSINESPLSVNFIRKGCVVESLNGVLMIQNDEARRLENETVVSIKTYLSSIRYKNIISIVHENGVNLYSVFPSL